MQQQISKLCSLVLLFACFLTTAHAQQPYVLSGNITGLTGEVKVFLSYGRGISAVKDSVVTSTGDFSFKGAIPQPVKASISLVPMHLLPGESPYSRDMREFYLCPGSNQISGSSLATAAATGGKSQDEFVQLMAQMEAVRTAMARPGYRGQDKDSMAAARAHYRATEKAVDEAQQNFAKANGNSYVAFDIVKDHAFVIENPDAFGAMFNALNKDFKATAEGQKMAKNLAIAKRLDIGQPALDFSHADTSGHPVSLSALKGKYVLVDFWASWCGPCRIEYPFLKKAYSRFKDKNFEIIGISWDEDKDKWLKAIRENEFTWLQTSDLKGHQSELFATYGITAIPQSFLVDPQGVIIAKNLRGENLIQKLEEVLK
jgi:peroxiredoxin